MRVVVLIDWQNTYKQARAAFGLEKAGAGAERGIVSPLQLAHALARRNGRRRHTLVKVEVHRGLADPRRDPKGNSAALRQRDAWLEEAPDIIDPKLRPLAYNPDTGEPEEKGVDVAIAVSALEWSILGQTDLVIIFSHDSDLLPGIAAVSRLYGSSKIETGSWWSKDYGYWKRIPETPGVKNNALDEKMFLQIETPINYRTPS